MVLKLDADGNIPGCELINNTSVSSVNTIFVTNTLEGTPPFGYETSTITSVIATNTNTAVDEQCFDEGPVGFVDVPDGY